MLDMSYQEFSEGLLVLCLLLGTGVCGCADSRLQMMH